MCIALLSTAHPKYAFIAINNRDEFILRPTSKPHWWTATAAAGSIAPCPGGQNGGALTEPPQEILASRDLYRPERGTWLGITRAGHFAALTNYREIDPVTGAPSATGARSRGAMATAWLGAPRAQSVAGFVEAMVAGGGTRDVGGFSLICGKLRRRRQQHGGGMAPLAILSNTAAGLEQIPWIVGERGQTVGLSNAAWGAGVEWRKVTKGKELLVETINDAVQGGWSQDKLQGELFKLLDDDDLPRPSEMGLGHQLKELHNSIFIPLVGNQEHRDAMGEAAAKAEGNGHADAGLKKLENAVDEAEGNQSSGVPKTFNSGMYGTQRQTVILVDWDGNVTFTERALFDESGRAVEKGKGDETFQFHIEGWDQS